MVTMKKLSVLLMLSIALVPVLTTASSAPQTADAVIEKHLEALGGRAALVKLTSRKSTGTITISTPGGDLTGPVELYAKAPNKTRAYTELDLSAMGMTEKMLLDQRYNGVTGWVLNSLQGDGEMPAWQQAGMKNNVFPTPLLTYKEAGTTITLLPPEKVGAKDAVVLQITPKSGPASKVYLDPDTYLVMRTTSKAPSADGVEVDQVGEPSDYQVVDGVKINFMIVTTTPTQVVTIKLTKVEHNIAIDDAMFGGK
jgi:outer membrane lipoprotein-sorting protein